MQILLATLLAANLLALLWLLWRQLRTQRLLGELQRNAQALEPLRAELDPALTRELTRGSDTVIGVEILNPLEVAAKANWIAGPVGGLAPSLIRREVYRQTRAIMQEQLAAQGIESRVQLYRRP